MLSIDGQTFGEVFTSLSHHDELDSREQAAAAAIGAWCLEWERLQCALAQANENMDRDKWYEIVGEMDRFSKKKPFVGPQNAHVQMGAEWRTIIYGTVKFQVWPYTDSQSMNIGVSEVERETADV